MIGRGSQQERLADGKVWRWWDRQTGETTQIRAPVEYKDDFHGASPGANWGTIEQFTAGTLVFGPTPDFTSGGIRAGLSSTSEAQEAGYYFGDIRPFFMGFNFQWEARIRVSSASFTNLIMVAGVASDHASVKDNVQTNAWFRLDGSLLLKVETDDDVHDQDDVSTGLTWVTDTWKVLRIKSADFGLPTSFVKFFVDGVQVAETTNFNMSDLTSGTALVQPFISVQKSTGAQLATIDIDYVRCWGTRTSL